MGIALKGDFIGFQIGNVHSSELGIIRTSDGSRFNENLLPTIQDKTVQVPGGDGFYYFGSYYTQRQFNIPIAFDNMTEAQFRRLRQIIGNKDMVQLIFDEAPYKYYSVKSTGSPILKYICFDTETTPNQRIYKGEGTLNFIAYDPFGYARATGLEELRTLINGDKDAEIINEKEWAFDIGFGENYKYPLPLVSQTGAFMTDNATEGELKPFYNCGDLPADYQIFCTLSINSTTEEETESDNTETVEDTEVDDDEGGSAAETNTSAEKVITIINSQVKDDETLNEDASLFLNLKVDADESQINFCFDSKTNCVYGWTEDANGVKQINYDIIYNKYLTAARFDKIPVGAQTLWVIGVKGAPDINIKYKYF